MISAELELLKIIAAEWSARLIYIAVKFELVDELAKGDRSTAQLAEFAQVPESHLRRILLGLEKLSLVEVDSEDIVSLTSLGASLKPGSTGGLNAWVRLWGEEFRMAWGGFPEAVREGKTAFDHVFGTNLFAYLGCKPEVAKRFDEAMTGLAEVLYNGVVNTFDFSSYRHVVDVGGGRGKLLSMILSQFANVRGTLFDQPHVADGAAASLQAQFGGRVSVVGGDFFEGVPEGGDAYILSNVIHDWDDDKAVAILSKVRNSISPGGRLLLVEMALGGKSEEPDLARMTDLNMLTLTGGKERTRQDFVRLLGRARFELVGFKALQPMTCLLEATPF